MREKKEPAQAKPSLEKWLHTPCRDEDTLPHQTEEGVRYMPIPVVREKIRYMETTYDVVVDELDFKVTPHNDFNKDTYYSGVIILDMRSINLTNIGQKLVGAATFNTKNYDKNTHFAAIARSLATVNAFGAKYPQFGSLLNRDDLVIVRAETVHKPKADVVMMKKFLQALAAGDIETVNEIAEQYDVRP